MERASKKLSPRLEPQFLCSLHPLGQPRVRDHDDGPALWNRPEQVEKQRISKALIHPRGRLIENEDRKIGQNRAS